MTTDFGSDHVRLTHDVYDPDALREAIAHYHNHLAATIVSDEPGESTVRLTNPNGTAADELVVREFLNYLLDLSIRAKLGSA